MAGKTVLVTGGAGFIGANFIPYFLDNFPQYQVVNLDKLTYAGNLSNLAECQNNPRYTFVKGDICDAELVNKLFSDYDIRGVFHFAAESHVDNSIAGPLPFIKTNIEGTFTLLEAARKHWMLAPGQVKPGYEECRFHHISTDEVYGSLGATGLFTEHTAYAPNSPYSASKASSDFLVRAYFHTYGLNVTTSNCSNNYGPKQHAEKLIPTIIRKALTGQPIPIYGDGKNVRDWLYVLDHCKGITTVWQKGRSGETYNIGGRNERNNLEIVDTICSLLDELKPAADGKPYKHLVTFVKDRAGHDRRYAIDASKLETELGWKAQETFKEGMRKTVQWYLDRFFAFPKLSIILPVYNCEKTVVRALKSALNQTYLNKEIIVVYLESQDNTYAMLKPFIDSRAIKFVSQPSKTGPGGARNLGIEAATGELIGFVEADDELAPDFYEKLASDLLATNSDIAWGQMYDNGKIIPAPQGHVYQTFPTGYFLLRNGASFDKLFKAELIKKHHLRFIENHRWEDNPFLLKAFFYAKQVCVNHLARYNYNSTPWTASYRKALQQDVLPVAKEMLDFAKQNHFSPQQTLLLQKFIVESFAGHFIGEATVYKPLAKEMNYPFFLFRMYMRKRRKYWTRFILHREQKND